MNLSLGQQQKISLLRFFVKNFNKEYWILDEPLSNLDLQSIKELKLFLSKFSVKKKIILVSHDDYFDDITSELYSIENGIMKSLSKCNG